MFGTKSQFDRDHAQTAVADQIRFHGYDVTVTGYGVRVSDANAGDIRDVVDVPPSSVKNRNNGDVFVSL